ncbi:MAG: hypothetical protein COB20_11105 [SAR86 cluster bacterium]|uniref:Uncharacterized protein n=1 Tax=SAR86 cluster bacterium TaxID=2030880 RepID=A0A2A4X155_9GAMM|nr:MAG: hypothetical protein COB20_11105 [SAR86 cluster bacterium]
MNSIILRSSVCGFTLGAILFAIAPLGLGISFIEVLKPFLVPGVLITQLILGNNAGSIPIMLALLMNGVIFTLPFIGYFLIRTNTRKP